MVFQRISLLHGIPSCIPASLLILWISIGKDGVTKHYMIKHFMNNLPYGCYITNIKYPILLGSRGLVSSPVARVADLLDILPDIDDMDTLLFWRNSELKELEGSTLFSTLFAFGLIFQLVPQAEERPLMKNMSGFKETYLSHIRRCGSQNPLKINGTGQSPSYELPMFSCIHQMENFVLR